MKKHAIIPIFIPHKGCPNDCVFCNQRKITARVNPPSSREVHDTVEKWLSTLKSVPTVEMAFFGGSFTGLTLDEQNIYLEIAEEYKQKGAIAKIHISTRPDYIDEKILTNLKSHKVDIIELGAQSFDDRVLKASNRGHLSSDIRRASYLIKQYGFSLGIQLMIGLPEDSMKTCIFSAEETVKLKPDIARIYPTVIIDETELYNMYKSGIYEPLSRDEAVVRSLAVYEILREAGINVIRIGLKSSDLINSNDTSSVNGGTYHPAFRQLVEGAFARKKVDKELLYIINNSKYTLEDENNKRKIYIHANSLWFSNLVGHKGENKKYFAKKYPQFILSYKIDNRIENGHFKIIAES